MKKPSILCVDDEVNILEGLQDNLRKQYKVFTATSGAEALALIESEGPFPVVISDMRMPQMNGAEFLSKVREISPSTIRILLTGQSDMDSAISAVNEGQIFRFLTKPCPTDTLSSIIDVALEHYRLTTLEKDLLENTVQGCVEALVEVLQLTNPVAFSRTNRIKEYVAHIANELNLSDRWQYEVAALLSQVGFVTLPSETLKKMFAGQPLDDDEEVLLNQHPEVAYRLISKIPRLEQVAAMIRKQHSFHQMNEEAVENAEDSDSTDTDPTLEGVGASAKAGDHLETSLEITTGAQILNIASEYDKHIGLGATHNTAISAIKKTLDPELATMIDTLKNLTLAKDNDNTVFKMANAEDLSQGMILDQEVTATNGMLLIANGQVVTETVIQRLNAFSKKKVLQQPFRVRVAA